MDSHQQHHEHLTKQPLKVFSDREDRLIGSKDEHTGTQPISVGYPYELCGGLVLPSLPFFLAVIKGLSVV